MIEIVTEYFEYSREEILEMLDFDYKWSPCGKYWYDEEGVKASLIPGDVMRLWKHAEEINKQLLEACKEGLEIVQLENYNGWWDDEVDCLKAAIMAAEGI